MAKHNPSSLLHRLTERAREVADGHLTIMRFTTNWRVGFGTPCEYHDIARMASGPTFARAAEAALADGHHLMDRPSETEALYAKWDAEYAAAWDAAAMEEEEGEA